MQEDRFKQGYYSALSEIMKGREPEKVLKEASGDLDRDAYYRGWVTACKNLTANKEQIDYVTKARDLLSFEIFGKPFNSLSTESRNTIKANMYAYHYGAIKPIGIKKYGWLFRWKSFWIGLHYSDYNKRYCLNIVPCITIWWIKEGGKMPDNN